jgi:DMSO reductase family type II enzyme heme b subunit
MKGSKLSPFWLAIIVMVVAFVIFTNAFPPLLPTSLLIQYMIITLLGVLLFFSFNDKVWNEFKKPVAAVLREDSLKNVRWVLLIAIPGVISYTTYVMIKPGIDSPVELRQVHPAPPLKLKAFGKKYDLTRLENPLRMEIVEKLKTEPEVAKEIYHEAVVAGRDKYYQNCFYCHGDLLDGDGPFAKGINPLPANFQDVGTIAQLQESFLFWRISTGGPGLPKEGTPWNSAMPVWHEMLEEEDVWNLIMFLYDYVGQVPRMWDQGISSAVSGMKNEVLAARKNMSGKDIYTFRCEICHGETGMGDGPAAKFMYPRPRDFSLGLFKYKTSPGTLPPRDEDLFDIIKHGLTGTAMPGWKSLIKDKDIRKLIPVIKRFDITASWSPEDAEDEDFDDDGYYLQGDLKIITDIEPTDGQIAYSDESIAKGQEVFKVCKECHGTEGRGNITSGKKLKDDWGNRLWPRDLTRPWSWRITQVNGDNSQHETIKRIYQRLSIGILGTPMPAHRAVEEGNKDPLTLEDRWNVANYVYSLRGKSTPVGDGVIRGIKVEEALPDSIDDKRWDQVEAETMLLFPNIIKGERLFTPLSEAVTVRVMYDKDEIAFLLELNDRTDSRPGEKVSTLIHDASKSMHADAFAIQFPMEGAFETAPIVIKPLYRHGDMKRNTSIWYWNAGSVEPQVPAQTMVFIAKGSNKKLEPNSVDAGVTASGAWQHGQWRVLMKRSRNANENSGEISFNEGQFIPISFANWDGNNGEAGSRHTLTSWYWLVLPPELNTTKVYGLPAVVGMVLFLLGLAWVKIQRNKYRSA